MTARRPARTFGAGRPSVVEVEHISPVDASTLARRQRRGVLVRVIGTRRFPTDISPAFELAIHQDWPNLLAAVGHGDVATRDPMGNTFLHYAATWGHLPTVVALVAVGVPIGYRNQRLLTACDVAGERGHDAIATYLACRERPPSPPRRWPRIRRAARVDEDHLLVGPGVGSSVPLDGISGVALSGPWQPRSLLLAVGHRDGRPLPRDGAFSARDLAAVGGRATVVTVDAGAPHLLWALLPALIERGIPVGVLAHRWAALEGWAGRRAAAIGVQPSDRLTVAPGEVTPVGEPVRGLAVLPSGFFIVRSGDGATAESSVSWPTLLHLARHHADDGPQIDLQMDQTFPWVEQVAAEVRASGIGGAHPTTMVAEPPLPHGGTALHAHLWSGRNDLAVDLVGTGFDLHRPDRFGRTPLHVAAALGADDVVAELLAHGADPDARDDAGRRPLLADSRPRG